MSRTARAKAATKRRDGEHMDWRSRVYASGKTRAKKLQLTREWHCRCRACEIARQGFQEAQVEWFRRELIADLAWNRDNEMDLDCDWHDLCSGDNDWYGDGEYAQWLDQPCAWAPGFTNGGDEIT